MPLNSGVLEVCEACVEFEEPCLKHEEPPVICPDCAAETQPEEWRYVDIDGGNPYVHDGCARPTCPHCGGVLPDAR